MDSTVDEQAVGDSSSDELGTFDDELDTPLTKKARRATQADLGMHHRRIVEHAKCHLYAKLATQKAGPFPVGLAQDAVLAEAWLAGFSEVAADLRLNPNMEPAEEDLAVVSTA